MRELYKESKAEFKWGDVFFLDFEYLTIEYDVIDFVLSDDARLYDAMYGWDCDPVLILNKKVIDVEI